MAALIRLISQGRAALNPFHMPRNKTRNTAARPWLISLISAAIAYLYLPTGWYVPIGAICGIASAFLFIQEDGL